MSYGISSLSSALSGIRAQERAMDRAAERIAQSGLEDPAVSAGAGASVSDQLAQAAGAALPTGDALTDNMVQIMIAQRMFVAAIRVAKTADQTLQESIQLAAPASGER
jgi:flagellar hook protein FlgE